MLINLRNALMAGKKLPYDAEVEYLESTGTQWIDTGYVPNGSETIMVTGAMTGTSSNSGLFGSVGSTGANVYLSASGSQSKFNSGWGSSVRTAGTFDTNLHAFETGLLRGFWCDGVLLDTFGTNSQAYGKSIALFMRDNGYPAHARISHFYIEGIIDLIPVRKGTVGYLYDRVSGKLFGNAGTGDFVLGPDVVPVEYIESHGTEWIDTGFVPSGQTKWELDAIFPIGSGFSPMGAMSTSPDSRFLIGREQNPSYFNMSCGPNNAMRITVDGSRKLFVLDAQNDTWRIGDTSGTFPTGTFDTSAIRSVYLFARNKNGSAEYFNNGSRVFKSKLYNSNAIIQNSIPVRVGTEGAMMDTLTRRIYRNAGTGAFSYGNDLKYPIPA